MTLSSDLIKINEKLFVSFDDFLFDLMPEKSIPENDYNIGSVDDIQDISLKGYNKGVSVYENQFFCLLLKCNK